MAGGRGDAEDEVGGMAQSFHVLSVPLSWNFHVFTNLEALQTPSFWGFMEVSLPRHG